MRKFLCIALIAVAGLACLAVDAEAGIFRRCGGRGLFARVFSGGQSASCAGGSCAVR